MRNVLVLTALLGCCVALLAGCASKPIRSDTAGEYIDDATTTTQVNGLIVKDPDAHFFKIDVTTTQGVVVLEGSINSKETEERLAAKIREIKGVKSVRSLLKLEAKK